MYKTIFLTISLIFLLFSFALSWQVEAGSTGNELELAITGYPGNVPLTALMVNVANKPDWINFVSDSSTVKEAEETIEIQAYTDSLGEYYPERKVVVKKNISRFTFSVSSEVAIGTKGNVLLVVKDDKNRRWNKDIDIEVVQASNSKKGPKIDASEKILPIQFDLFQNYPNPFNPETSISFALSKDGYTILRIYDIGGRLIKTLINEHKTAGYYTVKWNGQNEKGEIVPSGLYLYRIISGEYSTTKRMLLLK